MRFYFLPLLTTTQIFYFETASPHIPLAVLNLLDQASLFFPAAILLPLPPDTEILVRKYHHARL